MCAMTWTAIWVCIGIAIASPCVAQKPDSTSGSHFLAWPDGFTKRPGRASFAQPGNSTIRPQVSNGVLADFKQWPATFLASGSGCTATAVGPKAILTAAHCLGGLTDVTVSIAGRDRLATCAVPKNFSEEYDLAGRDTVENWNRASLDVALCLVDDQGPALRPGKFETIDVATPNPSGTVRLVGFGCDGASLQSAGGGALTTATSIVYKAPAASNHYLELRADSSTNNGILCPGDSGGGAYAPPAIVGSQRKIVGVNSRTGVKADRKTLSGASFVSYLSTATLAKFVRDWAGSTIQVCGVNWSSKDCRS